MSRLSQALRPFRWRFTTLPRRTTGFHNDRMDGLLDLLPRAKGASILDLGCYRGMVSLEFAMNGASLVHGCDKFEAGVECARQIFADLPVESRFEHADLSGGMPALNAAFGNSLLKKYDIVLFLGMHHHLRREMQERELSDFVQQIARLAGRYFVHRTKGPSKLESAVEAIGMTKVHYSALSSSASPVAVYAAN